MRALALVLASFPALATPPVTQAEAVAYHTSGQCQMIEPGSGLRADGQGWIVSMFPGKHLVYAKGGAVSTLDGKVAMFFDMDAGRPYRIKVSPPDAPVFWCVPYAQRGRDRCGAVPAAFLYEAKTVR